MDSPAQQVNGGTGFLPQMRINGTDRFGEIQIPQDIVKSDISKTAVKLCVFK